MTAFNRTGTCKRLCAFCADSLVGQIAGSLVSVLMTNEITWLIWCVYILFKDCINGQSVGRMLVGIRVEGLDGQPAPAGRTILRNVFMIIPFFQVIEYIAICLDTLFGKRIGDHIAKTRVHDLYPLRKGGFFLLIAFLFVIAMAFVHVGFKELLLQKDPTMFG